MSQPLLLERLIIDTQCYVEEEALLVTTFAGTLYQCERIFPFHRILQLCFSLPTYPDVLLDALHAGWLAQRLIAWEMTFNTSLQVQEQSYLIWQGYDSTTVEIHLARPL